ncbi:ABC transporter ATP-binding protein/permease [Paenibacillus polymyxa]|uniref:ATP-binding cassette domain-containing protein n=1 Tax=Paenibacillus polymyxa TaxID=1406 RepID=UPI0004D3E487|nr:ABC transporter ATP-binding protein [Paenibacillus polymyxa]KEO78086.1 multidrug ABC transporter permease [Paenibacillus polymyxa]MCH6188635.1 ABC transporter ATP-binding protein/permease [Paenibacillus polymyxa]WRL58007.1 ABC transporter ATP-binding protein [Paenibacillus polymyxa]
MYKILKIALKHTILIYLFVVLFDAISYSVIFTITGIARRDIFNELQGLETIINLNIVALVILSTLAPLVVNVTKQINGYLFATAQQNISNNLKEYIYIIIYKLPINRKINDTSGEIITRFRDDNADIVNFFTEIYNQIPKLMMSVITLIIMFKINTYLTIISVVPLLIVIFTIHRIQGRLVKNKRLARQSTDKATQFLGDIFSSLDVIKVSDKTEKYVKHYKELCKSRGRYSIKDVFLQNLLSLFSLNLMFFALAVILFFAYNAIKAGTFTIGDFILFEYYFWFLTDLPGVFSSVYSKYKQLAVAKQRIQEFEPLADTENNTMKHSDSVNGIFIQNKYKIKKNELCLIKGKNGGGKSMLLKIIFTNQSNEICWLTKDGEANNISMKPPQICYLSQSTRLFSDTIKNNICMGLEYNEKKLFEVLKVASLEHEFQQGKLELNTYVGNSGEQLSGGQIKRLALARLLYREPEVILLDDLTSGLDVVTEQRIMENLKTLKNKIIIIASNSIQLNQYADKVISID